MEDAGLAETVEVFNVAGRRRHRRPAAPGQRGGQRDLLMQMGLGVVGAEFTNKSQAKLAETTPIAGLIEEAEVIVVPADSPYQDLESLTEAWKADPGKLPVGWRVQPGRSGPPHPDAAGRGGRRRPDHGQLRALRRRR
jgi:putative tricarboxylic transport membrane protein